LLDATRIMGVSMLRVLGYPDRGLQHAPADTIRRQLVEAIRALQPQVVVTFDPNGSNLHPDHVAISRFTSDAVAAAGDARWYAELGPAWAVPRLVWTLPDRPWRLMGDARFDPVSCPSVDFAVDTRPWVAQKTAALRAHRTQHLALGRILLSKPDVERLLGVELFRQAWGPALHQRPARDLFDGVS